MTTLISDIVENIDLPNDDLDILIEDFISNHNYYFGTTATSGISASYIKYADDADEWRVEAFRNTWNQAYKDRHLVYNDNINTPLYKEDMEAYDSLISGDDTSSVTFTIEPSASSYVSIELPEWQTVNILKLDVIDGDGNDMYFGYSYDNIDWYYIADTPSTHTSEALSFYTTETDAMSAYCTLVSGLNKFTIANTKLRYLKLFFISDTTSYDVELSLFKCGQQTYIEDLAAGTIDTSRLVISSPDGRTTFDGNTLKVIDTLGNTRVELGLLE